MVNVYTDVPTDHQLDLELNAMAVLWESRKEGQSLRRLQYSGQCPLGIAHGNPMKSLIFRRPPETSISPHFSTPETGD